MIGYRNFHQYSNPSEDIKVYKFVHKLTNLITLLKL